jgi:hypothetical protein
MPVGVRDHFQQQAWCFVQLKLLRRNVPQAMSFAKRSQCVLALEYPPIENPFEHLETLRISSTSL